MISDCAELKKPVSKLHLFHEPEFLEPELKSPEFLEPEFLEPEFKSPEFLEPEFKSPEFPRPVLSHPEFTICKISFHDNSRIRVSWRHTCLESSSCSSETPM